MSIQDVDSGVASEEELHPSSTDVTCNCELCHARQYVSAKHNIEDEYPSMHDQLDVFHLLPSSKSNTSNSPQCNMPMVIPWAGPMPFYVDPTQYHSTSYGKLSLINGAKVCGDGSNFINSFYDANGRAAMNSLILDHDFESFSGHTPQVYISKDSVLHIRLSAYVSVERSLSAYRLINYRNNSALALNESGEYGYAYHYNCRGLINMHHGKLSITFDKDRQVLLRCEKPSFVKKEMEFYRLTSHHWTACRPVSMDTFDRDRTPEILKKVGVDKTFDESKLRELVKNSAVHKDACGLIIYLGDAKIEHKVNGDVILSWFFEDRANSLIVSPLSGSFSLSTKNLEIMATPKSDIYIAFCDFFVHVGGQQMTVSSGAVAGSCHFGKSHPCLLKLNSSATDTQAGELRQYCTYAHPLHSNTNGTTTTGLHRRQTPILNSAGTTRSSVTPVSQHSGDNSNERVEDQARSESRLKLNTSSTKKE